MVVWVFFENFRRVADHRLKYRYSYPRWIDPESYGEEELSHWEQFLKRKVWTYNSSGEKVLKEILVNRRFWERSPLFEKEVDDDYGGWLYDDIGIRRLMDDLSGPEDYSSDDEPVFSYYYAGDAG